MQWAVWDRCRNSPATMIIGRAVYSLSSVSCTMTGLDSLASARWWCRNGRDAEDAENSEIELDLKSRGFSYFFVSFVFLFVLPFDSINFYSELLSIVAFSHCFTCCNINSWLFCFISLLFSFFHAFMTHGMPSCQILSSLQTNISTQSSVLNHHDQTKTPRSPGPSTKLPFVIAYQRRDLKSLMFLGRPGRTRPTICISHQGNTTTAWGENQRWESLTYFHSRILETQHPYHQET